MNEINSTLNKLNLDDVAVFSLLFDYANFLEDFHDSGGDIARYGFDEDTQKCLSQIFTEYKFGKYDLYSVGHDVLVEHLIYRFSKYVGTIFTENVTPNGRYVQMEGWFEPTPSKQMRFFKGFSKVRTRVIARELRNLILENLPKFVSQHSIKEVINFNICECRNDAEKNAFMKYAGMTREHIEYINRVSDIEV